MTLQLLPSDGLTLVIGPMFFPLPLTSSVLPLLIFLTFTFLLPLLTSSVPFLETWTFIPIAQDVLRTVLRTVRVPGSHRQGEAGSRGGPCSQEPVPPGIGLLNNPASSALHAPLGLCGRRSPTSSTHARCDSSRVAAG